MSADDLLPDTIEALAAVGVNQLGLALVPTEMLPVGVKQGVAVAVAAYRRRKAKAFWENAMSVGESVHDFVDWVNARLAEDPDRITASFAEGARAAAEKADLAAIPSIGLLTRRYAAGQVPKWFFRGALDLLTSLGAFEFGILTDLAHQISTVHADDGHITVSNAKGPATAFPSKAPSKGVALEFRGSSNNQLSRYLRLLKQCGLGHESGAYGIGGSHNAMVIEAETVRWLCGILPR